MSLEPIDLVVNVFERTYKDVMVSGFFSSLEDQNQRSFNKILLVNNVNDEKDVFAMADSLIARNEIDEWYSVASLLPRALDNVGLTLKALGRIPYYSTAPFVAANIHKNPFLLYWDADVRLFASQNWVDEAQNLLNRDSKIFCVNPRWSGSSVENESIIIRDGFSLSYGFSDQIFLVRRGTFSQPIYNYTCLASFRYPLAHIAPDFEQMVDSFSRVRRLLRATYLDATYTHPNEGASYPRITFSEHVRRFLMDRMLQATQFMPTNNPCLKINPNALDMRDIYNNE